MVAAPLANEMALTTCWGEIKQGPRTRESVNERITLAQQTLGLEG